MVRILHAADFHLDSPFEALPPELAASRREEQRELLKRMADIAERERVQLILLSGDLFDSSKAYYETSDFLLNVLSQIKADVFISPGNHDFYNSRSPYAILDFPKNVHIFSSGAIQYFDLPEIGVRVYGCAFTDQVAEGPLKNFEAEDDGLISIGVFHADTSSAQSRYGPVSETEIVASRLDYLALGHVHAFSGVKKSGKTFYAYPGCPEGRGFDETGEKGILLGNVGKGLCDLDFVPLDGRRYEVLRVAAEDLDNLLAAIPPHTERDIYRIILTGEYDGAIDTAALKESIAERFYYVTVKNETRIKRDIWDRAHEDTLRGLFLRRMRRKYDEATEDEKSRVVLAVRYALAAMENGEEWQG